MDEPTDVKEFFEQMAQERSWSKRLYEGPALEANLKTYNFITRRDAVQKMLAKEGRFERVLDVGCGSGDYLPIAEEHGASYHGIDFAQTMIAQARDLIEGFGKEHLGVVGSGEKLPYRDESFDLVLALGYIEYFEDPRPAMEEIRRVMRPGGTLIMQSFKWNLHENLDRFFVRPLRELVGRAPAVPKMPVKWVDRRYSRRQTDELMQQFGFEVRESTYNNFFVFPPPLRKRFPRTYIRISEAMGRSTPTLWGFLAANYIARYVYRAEASADAA